MVTWWIQHKNKPNCNKVEYSERANQESGRIKIGKLRISRNKMSISEFRSDKIKKNNRNSILEYIKIENRESVINFFMTEVPIL